MNLQTTAVQNNNASNLEAGKQLQQQFLHFLQTKEEQHEDIETRQVITRFKYQAKAYSMIEEKRKTLEVDAEDLMNENGQIFNEIIQSFQKYEPFLQKAVQEFIASLQENQDEIENRQNALNVGQEQFFVSFYNFEYNHAKLRNLKTGQIGQLVSFNGTVTRSTDIRPELMVGAFQCMMCNSIVKGVQQEFKFTEPKFCTQQSCRNAVEWKLFTQGCIFTDMQKLRVQEDSADIPPGGMPRSLDVILRDTICDRVKPGDKVKITGSMIVIPDIQSLTKPGEKNMVVTQSDGIRTKNTQTQEGIRGLKQLGQRDLNYKLGFIGNSVIQVNDTQKSKKAYLDQLDEEEENISEQDIQAHFSQSELEQIQNMQSNPNLYEHLAKSIAPSVSGSDAIKKGILLMLFGGLHKKTQGGINLRGDLNVCIVGDPSTAKSQFLKYVANFLPRSVYTSGKASSAAGLTASVQRDQETGEYCVEAGALMLADHGVCCIDEFDKMGQGDQVAIHEAMEQQTISIAKAGIQATLNARASILAAANPIYGRYDKSKTLKQNLEMSAPIMSRFDLFFVVLDEQDQNNDKTIANYILKLHQNGEDELRDNYYYSKEEMQLYLKFCRYFKPALTKESALKLRQCYTKLRTNDQNSTQSSYMVTVRQLESMVRLSEALARVYGSQEIKASYVSEAYRLLANSILKIEKPDMEMNMDDDDEEQVQGEGQAKGLVENMIQKQKQDEQKKRNTMQIPYELYVQMVQRFIIYFRDLHSKQAQHAEENPDEEDIPFGISIQEAVEDYISTYIDELPDQEEQTVVEYMNRCYAVIKRMIRNENMLYIFKTDVVFEQQVIAINDNYLEQEEQ